MAHPFNEHRQHKVEHSRVSQITRGYATGGAVKHDDEAEDRKLIRSEMRKHDMKAEGRKNGGRLDRPHRAHGGKVGKGSGKTQVNIIVGRGNDQPPAIMPPPPAPPMAAAPPPRPPMPPPGPPPGAAPPPGMMPPRANGGRAYAKGGAVKSGRTWEEGRKNGTQISHAPGKNDSALIDHSRAKLTRKTGGKVEAGSGMGPKMHAGAYTGEGRLEKTALQKRK